ncbi:MAG: 16S rRNA pseudouridine(516) synthase [Ruminococcaceae bacterium]|nr:16S rRNA pseudouridine(516) synthase [Oscillospiraceae bacterium]
MERLDKIIAGQCGLTRSQARSRIWAGAVAVDGVTERAIDRKVDASAQSITLDRQPLCYRKYLYIMMNKPMGCVSASRDREERTVIDLLPQEWKRSGVAPAGRLDKDTEGLLILTDDGDFAHRLISPRKGVYKTYIARLDRPADEAAVKAFADGLVLVDGEKCLPAKLEFTQDPNTVRIRICEGKYHQVKRMCAAVGCHVEALRRVSIGSLKLDESLAPGESRLLTEEEMDKLLSGSR